ncbi:MAG: DUF1684 domain-containing protein, partial [Candidatus Krumholzibacteria bacterium]|nr:DUF1684 domain-containing protein [Candidatus Krumholzibacteria bacterium]
AIEITQNDRRVTLMELRPDTETERTVLEYGTMSWYVIIRGDKIGIRLRDRESHIRRGFEHIDRYPVDAHWRFEALLDKYEPMKFIPIDSVIDVVSNEPCIGAVVFEVGGETYRLDAIIEAHSPKLWVIFADETSGDETYGGGRYLYLDPPDDDGKLVIDFNVAENPPCAFSDYTTCPLPPPQNRLPIAVTAGEKTYRKHAE